MKGLDGHFVVVWCGDSGTLQPCCGAAAGVYFNGEGDEGENRGAGKKGNADVEERGGDSY